MIIRLSERVKLRPQQLDLFTAYFVHGIKFCCRVAHRRFGKDLEMFTLAWTEAIRVKGIYIYFLPTIAQSRHVIWETIGEEGKSLLERIPPQCVSKINQSDQKIVFTNGSILYVTGSDNYKRWIGMNARIVFFSEYQDSNPAALDALRPMITRNKGGIMINGTPRAYNHLGEMWHEQEKNPEWLVTNLTCEDTYEWDGSRIITPEMIEQERANGMPEDLIQQEYFGSWDAAMVGSYYGAIIRELKEGGRIDDSITFNPNFPVYTGWDVGWSDNTAVWFMQRHPSLGLCVFDYFEANQQKIDFYAEMMEKKRREYGWTKEREINFAPHDAFNESVGGGTLAALARPLGLQFIPVAKPNKKIHGIHLVRHKLPSFCFNGSKCHVGLKRLTDYRSDFDIKNGVIKLNPVHDAASHGADAFQTLVMGFMYKYEYGTYKKQIEYANLYNIDAAA